MKNKKEYKYVCSFCNKQFISHYKRRSIKNFCSKDCHDGYKNIAFKIVKICEFCGKNFTINQANPKRFCCKTCRISANGANSKPQQITNKILEELYIKYQNEYLFKHYNVDNYLLDHNLIIEVNGNYWHCNPILNKTVSNTMQKKAIAKDKTKHSYIKNHFDIEILYLWETDINKNYTLCKLLIEEYIKNYGVLNNYHSFNYFIENNKLKLKENLIIPYMEYENKELLKICDYIDIPQSV